MLSSRIPTPLLCLLVVSNNVCAAPFLHRRAGPFDREFAPEPNRDQLPGQICGLVGGYVLTVLIWGILLLTVGRRMRRKTENSPRTLELELVTKQRPSLKSPTSPGSAKSWMKKTFKRDKPTDSAIGSPQSPTVQSPSSFDHKVLEADKERAQAEMERLYAAVMDHDRKKSYSQVSTEEAELTERRPSAINTSRDRASSNPGSPVKAIYPPGYQHNGPPTAPLPRERPSSPRSILSKKSHHSNTSSSSKTRFNLKNLRISGPIQKYPGENPHDEARTPLSPRFYNPGAPPSPPTQQHSPTTPRDGDEDYERLDEVQPLPRPAPQRAGSSTHSPTSASHPQPTKSATSSASSLPLRGFQEPLKSPDLRTTVLDRRVDKLSMTTPKTGVPYTPYSPYMPFTPVTPVTPHLVTKKERKMMNKMGGRKRQGGDDIVQSPKEIFGDAW